MTGIEVFAVLFVALVVVVLCLIDEPQYTSRDLELAEEVRRLLLPTRKAAEALRQVGLTMTETARAFECLTSVLSNDFASVTWRKSKQKRE